ncbi:GTP-binding protein [Melissococcus sp. OM08-11BH]|uniref:CobW family GTP-binding protein n=1 Tax=Melissococcus sp. OM08-11BH TaxID=2293110 RepID=UPI000E4B821D|nr:GTP-binding protein [Melissococcus sp. OM08-11BH]RGI32056.1 GTP-binding protein [Melissococcus sp. OM08-11BH]
MGIPITVISGFLGSGKTTLINQVIKGSDLAPEEVVIIENEFGEAGIDHELLIHSKENIVQMNGGCICCSLRGDLLNALTAVLDVFVTQDYPIKQVIIETSGVSDPQPIIQTIVGTPNLQPYFYLDGVIGVVDAENIEQNLQHHEATKQLVMSDRLLISQKGVTNKDSMNQMKEQLKEINPLADIYEFSLIQSSSELADLVLGNHLFNQSIDDEEEHHHHHHHEFESMIISESGYVKEGLLHNWLSWLMMNYQESIYRIKGFVNVSDQDFQTEIQGVNQLLNFNLTNRLTEDNDNKLVIIGKNIDKDDINQAFQLVIEKSTEGD